MLEGRRLPRGRKRVGLKELVWYLDGLNGCAKDIWYFFNKLNLNNHVLKEKRGRHYCRPLLFY